MYFVLSKKRYINVLLLSSAQTSDAAFDCIVAKYPVAMVMSNNKRGETAFIFSHKRRRDAGGSGVCMYDILCDHQLGIERKYIHDREHQLRTTALHLSMIAIVRPI